MNGSIATEENTHDFHKIQTKKQIFKKLFQEENSVKIDDNTSKNFMNAFSKNIFRNSPINEDEDNEPQLSARDQRNNSTKKEHSKRRSYQNKLGKIEIQEVKLKKSIVRNHISQVEADEQVHTPVNKKKVLRIYS